MSRGKLERELAEVMETLGGTLSRRGGMWYWLSKDGVSETRCSSLAEALSEAARMVVFESIRTAGEAE